MTHKARTIGFIGLGVMGQALAKAVGQVANVTLLLSNHNADKIRLLAAQLGADILDNKALVARADVLFFGVKPSVLPGLLADLHEVLQKRDGLLCISMAAGISLADLTHYSKYPYWARMMPNTPVAIGQGMTVFVAPDRVSSTCFAKLMQYAGKTLEVTESQMDAATAIAGCGPAFVYEMIDAMTQAGILGGLSCDTAQALTLQTLKGAVAMVERADYHPAQLRDEVCSPGGATIAGLVAMQRAGFARALIEGVEAARMRTGELGKRADQEDR